MVVLDLGHWNFSSLWVEEFDLSIGVSTTLEHGEAPWLEVTLLHVEFLLDNPFSVVWMMGVWSSILDEDFVNSISVLREEEDTTIIRVDICSVHSVHFGLDGTLELE